LYPQQEQKVLIDPSVGSMNIFQCYVLAPGKTLIRWLAVMIKRDTLILMEHFADMGLTAIL